MSDFATHATGCGLCTIVCFIIGICVFLNGYDSALAGGGVNLAFTVIDAPIIYSEWRIGTCCNGYPADRDNCRYGSTCYKCAVKVRKDGAGGGTCSITVEDTANTEEKIKSICFERYGVNNTATVYVRKTTGECSTYSAPRTTQIVGLSFLCIALLFGCCTLLCFSLYTEAKNSFSTYHHHQTRSHGGHTSTIIYESPLSEITTTSDV